MNRIIPLIFFICFSVSTEAQVGIGKINPEADLDIASITATEPSLGLEPKVAPVGTATGQVTVIDDQLYMYDAGRTAWLTAGGVALQYGRNGNIDNERLDMGGSRANDTGYLMPFDGTIVAITARASSNVSANKEVEIRLRSGTTTSSAYSFNISNGTAQYSETTTNIDFSAGEYINVRGRGSIVATSLVVVLWVKWRP
ncbi:hypothetical protein KH5_21990 [Urechidicola sp. KH5]